MWDDGLICIIINFLIINTDALSVKVDTSPTWAESKIRK